jgi:hypothetical protein
MLLTVYHIHVQAEGAAGQAVHAPPHQRCAQRRVLRLHRQPHAHRGGRGRRLREALRHGHRPHHPGPDNQRTPPRQAARRLPAGHAPHAGAALLHGQPGNLRQHHGRGRARVRAARPHQGTPALPPVAAADQRHGLRGQLQRQAAEPGQPACRGAWTGPSSSPWGWARTRAR